MTHTLVTILGKAQGRDGDAGYREATYRFPDGTEDRSAFFGLSLARHLQPDVIVILGTASSMWSVLVESLAEDRNDEHARALMEAEKDGKVSQDLLNRSRASMERAMNVTVRPTLIPKARTEAEQYGILEAVQKTVARNSALDFDLTHGFRHLGMVGFLSSFMLERLDRLEVRGLWYGALDMTEADITPVLRLDGLVRVRRWLDALDRFDATGDYAVFSPLLKGDGVSENKARCLEAAAFLERTLNVRDAASKLKAFLPALDAPLSGASGLFRRRLAIRLRWAKEDRLSEQQRLLAHQYLTRGDFVRAAMFAKEACESRLLEDNNAEVSEHYSEDRQAEVKELADELYGPRRNGYFALTAMRNALAHGTRPKRRDIEIALKDPKDLDHELKAALNRFFG